MIDRQISHSIIFRPGPEAAEGLIRDGDSFVIAWA